MGLAVAALGEGPLVQRARAGDATAFADLFSRYQAPIYVYLCRLVGDRDEAGDLAQETFLKAYEALPATGPELHLSAWLYRIATNTAISALRRRSLIRWIPLVTGEDGPRDTSREGLPETVVEAEAIERTLRRLSHDDAICLLLHDHEGLTSEEVGEVMRLSPGTVRVKLSRARRRFRELYMRENPGSARGRQ